MFVCCLFEMRSQVAQVGPELLGLITVLILPDTDALGMCMLLSKKQSLVILNVRIRPLAHIRY